jgi:hypothetical protein
MWHRLRQATLAALVVGVGAFGCHRTAVREKQPPPDPLLVSKKPIEGRPHSGEPRPTARGEVPPPAPPGGDFATVSTPADTSQLRPVRLLGVQPPGDGR